MYLHLGQDTVVRTDDIIGIFDIENATTSRVGRDYLNGAQKRGWVVGVSEEIPKSFVICTQDGQPKIYISQISSQTLKKRARFMKHISNVNL